MLAPIAAVIALFLGVSLSANFYLFKKLKSAKSAARDSYELQQFLHDLTGGTGLVQVSRIAPANVLLRSPRDL
jgi:hypothetical protein